MDTQERERLQYLLTTKKWNPYCILHSSISYDSDSLPEFALRKKVRWSMNSKQPSRYIKTRMGNELRNQLLARSGIVHEASKPKITNRVCTKCERVNQPSFDYCEGCGGPLTAAAFTKLSEAELKNRAQYEQRISNLEGIIIGLKTHVDELSTLAGKNVEKDLAGSILEEGD